MEDASKGVMETPDHLKKPPIVTYNSKTRIWQSPENSMPNSESSPDVQSLEKVVRKLESEKADLVNLLEMKEEKIKELD